jgi:hypothetical protein
MYRHSSHRQQLCLQEMSCLQLWGLDEQQQKVLRQPGSKMLLSLSGPPLEVCVRYSYAKYLPILHSKIPCAAGYKAGSNVNGRIGVSSTRPSGFAAEGANTSARCPGEIVKLMATNLFELSF